MSEPVLVKWSYIADGVETDFTTPSAYYPGTLKHYLNGQLIDPNDDDGLYELGGVDVRLKIPPRVNDVVHWYYHEEAPIGGGYQQPPQMLEAFDLHPEIYCVIDLRPSMIDAEDQSEDENIPQMIGNEHLKPEMVSAIDLRPEMVSAEEV